MLTEFQKQKLPRLFAVHDLNRDGVIRRDDFEEYTKRIANTRGWGRESAEYKELLAHFLTFWDGLERVAKARGPGQVTLSDWLDYWEQILGSPAMYDQIVPPIGRTLFKILDHDGDGKVTADEYGATLANSGVDVAEAGPAFERLDTNHDGLLSIDEFISLADQFFRSEDPDAPGHALFGIIPHEAGMTA